MELRNGVLRLEGFESKATGYHGFVSERDLTLSGIMAHIDGLKEQAQAMEQNIDEVGLEGVVNAWNTYDLRKHTARRVIAEYMALKVPGLVETKQSKIKKEGSFEFRLAAPDQKPDTQLK